MENLRIIIVVACLRLCRVHTANILGVAVIPSVSHKVVYQPLWKQLSLLGHQVTVLTPHPLNNPELVNLTEIDLGFSQKIWKNFNVSTSMHKDLPYSKIITNGYKILGNLVEAQVLHPTVQAFVHNKSKTFDVMLVEFLHPLVYALSAKFNCPMIGLSSFGVFISGYDAVGNPSHPVLNPDLFFPFFENEGFFYRLYSTYFSTLHRYYYYHHVVPKYDAIARKHIAKDIPYLGDIEKNVSLLFLNVNPVLHSIRPNVPAIIDIGRMHLRKKNPLPKDLQQEMDAAKEGVIYFSLGSNIKSVSLSSDIRQKMLEAFSELPYTIFWKWEDDHLARKPKNVFIRKWFPQQDILGHSNVKVFLTQGGLQSIEEAISNRVPFVVMPFFSDQPFNARKIVNLELGLRIDVEKMTKDEIKNILINVAENPKYRDNIKKASELMTDLPMTGLEKAVWWTEYVIRYKGARHLRSPAVDMPWYQYLLLDVFVFLSVTVIFLIYVIHVCISLIFKIIKNKFFTQN